MLRHIALNLLRLDPTQRKASLTVKCLLAATTDDYRARLLGLV